jgi:hypothetical protein
LHVACASCRVSKGGPPVPILEASGRRTPAGYVATVQVLLEAWGEYLLDRYGLGTSEPGCEHVEGGGWEVEGEGEDEGKGCVCMKFPCAPSVSQGGC